MMIGEFAARAGVGVETIRYYQRRGLLTQPARTGTGYRDYSAADLLQLRFILQCKGLGFTLSEIRELLELRVGAGRTADDVRRQAQRKLTDIAARISELERIRAALVRLIDGCRAGGPPEACALMHATGGNEDF
jgi:MerR family transcriptional regulator, copper efflux regulator